MTEAAHEASSAPEPAGTRLTLIAFAAACFAPVAALIAKTDEDTRETILLNLAFGAVALLVTIAFIPIVMRNTERKGLFGYDLNKAGTPLGQRKVPEALGLAPGVVYLVCTIAFQVLIAKDDGGPLSSTWLAEYNAALACVCFMLFLGFVDDVLDIPWRAKFVLPSIAALPLVVAYSGSTTVVIPRLLRPHLNGLEFLTLGVLYRVYMTLMTVFCTNSINIYAGLNGLEAGQTFVMGCAVLVTNLITIGSDDGTRVSVLGKESADLLREQHLLSVYLMIPLVFTTFGLLWYNWYPSRVFVGDTFTYFAGMTFAVAAILGHFAETLLLIFLPQLFNFLYSIPQLLKIVPCPRHRLPKLDPETGLLHPTSPNMNLVNFALRVMGPLPEQTLVLRLLLLQALCCAAGITAYRFFLSTL
mmetsp:Transcript_17356/g.56817  ORF Transcript_17356/g.56817 Transcript_17356/m.56817 type:complete len:415 (+) Transcript_17356:153-1397(+)|eukprot:CAMPEP_0170135588 /NCGR_PEP_ID=MMETSP0033_2-20121228/2556_1 /TAXON_ID=195969 /ORGANISM="Dolichomastix tenuilepis, Strain CCMP3274" /LENGTH=414 /DNA_ID=CAMNT_0010371189 /DNA_START=153 /DNA_END=1397 /DNA_ORIENTATION=-